MLLLTAYQYLNLEQDVTWEGLRKAYHSKARTLHPDMGGDMEDFISLQKAFEILKSDEKRQLLGNLKIFALPKTLSERRMNQRSALFFENLRELSIRSLRKVVS